MDDQANAVFPSPGDSPVETESRHWIDMSAVNAARLGRCLVPHEVRAYESVQDEALVYRSYLQSYWRLGVRLTVAHGSAAQALEREVYHEGQRAVFDELLRHSEVAVACSPEDAWQVLGFAVYDDLPSGLILHYVYVKRVFRRAGLGAELVMGRLGKRRRLIYTHYTGPWRGMMRSLKRRGVLAAYNPYLVR